MYDDGPVGNVGRQPATQCTARRGCASSSQRRHRRTGHPRGIAAWQMATSRRRPSAHARVPEVPGVA
eukprot:14791659-Alexandrium_andersonii.AAC.1